MTINIAFLVGVRMAGAFSLNSLEPSGRSIQAALRLNSVKTRVVQRFVCFAMLAVALVKVNPATQASEVADLPEAKALLAWVEELPQAKNPQHPNFEFFRSLKASLTKPADGRQRFVLPSSASRAKRQTLALRQAFTSDLERKQFESQLDDLLRSIRQKIQAAESEQQSEAAFRLRWAHVGLTMLSNQPFGDKWSPAEAIINPKRSGPNQNPNHPVTGWRGSSYEWIRTPHFDIASRGSKSDSAMLAELCEQVFAVWQQVFYDYWQVSGESLKASTTPYQVVLFANRREYEESLKRQVPNVELSTGYYSQGAKHSFFYLDQSKSYATLVHELTHQFFAEASSKPIEFDPDSTPGFWAAEGIALYMESLSIRELGPAILVDVGGWDAPRLQPARFHFLRNETWLTADSFGRMAGVTFRKPTDLALRYSHACGLVHRWMDSSRESRTQLIQFLKHLYFQDSNAILMPWDDEALPEAYAEYMQNIPASSLFYLPHGNRSDLVLSRCRVDSEWLIRLLGNKTAWNWIDVSFTQVDDAAFSAGGGPWDIARLSVENTKVTDASLTAFQQMARLTELDLTNCKITDIGVQQLAGNRSIRTLWLTGTQVTDDMLKVLEGMSRLESVHLDRTQISAEAWQQFLKKRPRLKATSTGPEE
ncbi:hypothetical protein SH449x_001376 [Pirellulaceae bacterium SH449]